MTNRADVLTGEEWRPIPGSDGLYSASNLGRIRSEPTKVATSGRQRGRVLALCLDPKGYPQFRLCLFGSHKTIKVHRCIAQTFLGPRPDGLQINHINGNKTDNRVENLEYVTASSNVIHAHRTGLCDGRAMGERSPKAKLTAEQVTAIRSLDGRLSLDQLSERFGVTKTNICYILNRKTWKHVA